MNHNESKFWHGISPWIFIGAVAIFTTLFAFITVENISRQKKNSTQLLAEKGAALIRSFEAGTRTGMMGMMGMHGGSGKFRLQRLLAETARQPDIAYLLVTNKEGGIVAHSNSDEIGNIYEDKLSETHALNMNILNWRELPGDDNKNIFEVFRKFSPEIRQDRRHDRMPPTHQELPEWHDRTEYRELKDLDPHIIFVGLDMTPVEEARKSEILRIVITSLILLAIGVSGIVLLFILQHHRLNEIRVLRQEIEKNQRLAAVGMLAAGVAHEIRNPLSSVKGFATYFKERYRDIPEDVHIADIMIQETDRLNRVVSQLLEFAKPVKLMKRPTCIRTLAADSLKIIEHQASEKHIDIRLEIPNQPIDADIDPDKIGQALLNLYLNAMDAMSQGGVLTVSAAKDKKRTGTVLRVADTGCGIRAEDIPHVFDPYFTTKSAGTGLGLAIVNNIIQTHGGKIHIAGAIGKGTTVNIWLP